MLLTEMKSGFDAKENAKIIYINEKTWNEYEEWLKIPFNVRLKRYEEATMVKFKEKTMGGREMTARLKDVHLDKVGENCPVTGKEPKSQQLHFIAAPSSPSGWKDQNIWFYDTDGIGSSWYDFVRQMRKLDVIDEDDIESSSDNLELAKKIIEKLGSKELKFGERRMGRAVKENWYPEAVAQ